MQDPGSNYEPGALADPVAGSFFRETCSPQLLAKTARFRNDAILRRLTFA
jgi:hypothetical protein